MGCVFWAHPIYFLIQIKFRNRDDLIYTKMKQQEVIRVRFKKQTTGGFYRPTRIVKFTEGDKTYYRKYNPNKHHSKDLDPNDFITEWEKGCAE